MPTNNYNRKRKRRCIDSITNDDRATLAQSLPVANLLLRGKVIVVSTQHQTTTTPTTITVVTSALERSSPSRVDTASILLHNCHDDTHNNNNEASIQSKNYTYKSLTKLCEQMGAKVVGQVHAQVHCVLATNAAVGLQRSDDDVNGGDGLEKTTTTTMNVPTQRVRKAWNRGIPVVRIQWIFDCIDQKCLLPLHDKYLHVQRQQQQNQPSVKSNMVPKPDSAGTDNKNHGDDANICEEKVVDLGCCCVCHEDGRPHCEWCVNCSVNMST
jgi:hypothetical protein